MKILSLTLSLILVATLASANNGIHPAKKAVKAEAINLFEAYNSFKENNSGKCTDQLTKIDFNLSKSISKEIPGNCSVDSLVFANNETGRWAYFKSVDLGYVRTIDANIIMQVDTKSDAVETIAEYLKGKGFSKDLSQSDIDQVVFKDQINSWIIDKRFKETTYSKLESTYTYKISMLGNYLDISIKEIIPVETTDKFPLKENIKTASYQ